MGFPAPLRPISPPSGSFMLQPNGPASVLGCRHLVGRNSCCSLRTHRRTNLHRESISSIVLCSRAYGLSFGSSLRLEGAGSMGVAAVPNGASTSMGRRRSFADMVNQTPHPILEVEIPLRPLKTFDGVLYVSFSKEEIERSTQPLKFSLVMKFLRQGLLLDTIRALN